MNRKVMVLPSTQYTVCPDGSVIKTIRIQHKTVKQETMRYRPSDKLRCLTGKVK